MCDTNAGLPHTAITTWDGFVYQGKIAIYHVLELLEDPATSSGYDLQLDSLEDFAILDGNTIISLHQVKAKKSQNYNTYQEAFVKLSEKAIKCGCGYARFHIAREIIDKTPLEIATTHPPVKLYSYENGHCCGVNEIDQKIEENIKALLIILYPNDNFKHSDDYAHKARNYLDQIVLKQVLKIHGIVHDNLLNDREAAYTQTIPFSEFHEILNDDLNQRGIGEDYYFYILLNNFNQYYQEYCIDDEKITEDELKKLSHCMWEIDKLKQPEMIQFIRNIMPHRDFKFDSLSDYKDSTFTKVEIQNAFLSILHKLRQPEFASKQFFHWNVDGNSFGPTTIHWGSSQTTKVCKDIVENASATDLEIMFEGSNLITTDINVKSISDKVPVLLGTPESEEKEEHRISKWKTVSLISLNNAEEIIND